MTRLLVLLALVVALPIDAQVTIVPASRVVQTLTENTTTAGTPANTNETTLWSYTLKANTLAADGMSVRITAWGTIAPGAAGTKTAKININNNLDNLAVRGTGQIDVVWWLQAVVTRTAAGFVQDIGNDITGTSNSGAGPSLSIIALNTAADTIITVTGINGVAVANDVVFRGAIVELLP